jgi:hypothetical protein
MKKVSDKRRKQMREYNEVKKELFLADLKTGKLRCFLSNNPIRIPEEMIGEDDNILIKIIDIHHITGERENEHLYDKEIMRPVIRHYHTQYHSLSTDKLLREWWYRDYLRRISVSHPDLYAKEIYKQRK